MTCAHDLDRNLFFMHYLNAYEIDKNTIVMDVASYPDGSVLAFYEMEHIMNKTIRDRVPYNPSLRRYISFKERK